jgi:hypothetical protein
MRQHLMPIIIHSPFAAVARAVSLDPRRTAPHRTRDAIARARARAARRRAGVLG